MANKIPVVGIPVDVKLIDNAAYHIVGEKYINAIAHAVDCYPLLLPATGSGKDMRSMQNKFSLENIAELVDGIFLPGSYSNIHPRRYGDSDEEAVPPIDEQRDDFTLDLIHVCIENEVPLLAVCRGFQEMNVAFGGSIHSEIHELDIFMDHRENFDMPRNQQYDHAHPVDFTDGGLLQRIYGKPTGMVNSLHGQGIHRLGSGLVVEAVAPDGLIEAICIEDGKSFNLGVQWHPEWRFWEDDLSQAVFGAFADAVKERSQAR